MSTVFCLRVGRALYSIAVRTLLRLVTNNLYGDFTMACPEQLKEAAKNWMELEIFVDWLGLCQEWDGSERFDVVCRALEFQFDFSQSKSRIF